MNKTYRVTLTTEERDELETLIHTGKSAAQTLTHARILLKADQQDVTGPAWTDAAIAEALEVSRATVARVRERFVAAGMDVALHRKAAVSTRLPKNRWRSGSPLDRADLWRPTRRMGTLDVARISGAPGALSLAHTYDAAATLTSPLLPGFACPVERLFQGITPEHQ